MKHEAEYLVLIEENLYEDLFLTFEKHASLVENKVEQRRQIREFITLLDEKFDDILEKGNLLLFAEKFVKAFRDIELLKETGDRLSASFDSEKLSLLFSLLVSSSRQDSLKDAKYLLPHINRNLQDFPQTVQSIIDNKNSEALFFLCENMDNIGYNQGELLRKSFNLPAQSIISLIENYDFDVNETDKNVTSSLLSELVFNKNIRNFKVITEKYINQIKWGQVYAVLGDANIFDIIDRSQAPLSFYDILLNQSDLKSNFVERIGNYLFEKEDTINSSAHTDIHTKLFSHNNFDHGVFNLGQGYCLYGLLTRLGINSVDEKNSNTSLKLELSKSYVKIIDAFLNSRQDDEMPEASNYNIIGAAIFVAKESPSNETVAACNLITRRYKNYINKPNPNGTLPISQLDESHILYRTLINNGAIPAEPPPSFWSSIAKKMGFKKEEAPVVAPQPEKVTQPQANSNSFAALKSQMRDDFRGMRDLLASDLCDDVVRMNCENMFLDATNLVTKMEKYKMDSTTEDVFFLGQNFSSYLNRSLKSYMKVCEAAVDFSRDEQRDEKLQLAKKDCLDAIKLLNKQINLIKDNFSAQVEGDVRNGVKVNKKFLENRLTNNDRLEELEKNLDVLVKHTDETILEPESNVVQVVPTPRKNKI